jgi:putative membrane-bound dehydrogenase-like protein
MITRSRSILALALALALALPLFSSAAEPLKQKVNLLDSIKSGNVVYHVNNSEKQTLKDPPEKIWSFMDNGQLKVSGRGFGYVRTKDVYKDYHLVIEYKFTGPTFGSRENKARDNGIFVHCHGPDGAYGGTWMAGIEAQIIEGGTGDILVLSPKLPDGTELTTSVTAEIGTDRDKEMIWKRGEPRKTITARRINWEKRDVDWKDEAGFRGRDDVESRLNEWTRMEVIAKGDTLQYFVNGVLVNECFECKPSEGYIFLQTEGAEMIVKRYELYPLGTYKEKWNPVSASGGSEVPVKASREAAISPAESQKLIEIDGNYEAQLVAAEPLVRDPVEITWDAQGRCYVADMIDYPLGPGPGLPPLSRIQQLIDDNKDGVYERAVTFADKMDHVQGLLPYKDGLIATTRTQILFVRDTNGDGIADERKPLVAGFNPNHSQLQVSAPRWGLDGCVYFNNGLDTKEIYPAESAGKKLNFARCNLRWDPGSGKLEPTTGFGQFGGSFDDWGRHFFCSNRNPVMFAVMPYEAVTRNPNAGITQGWEDIAPSGAESKINPLAITHTTADAHAGTHTAACGLGVYRGDLMPDLRGEIFVCEPTAQAIIRYHAEPNGASLKATRIGDHTEFLRSRDEWTRPVNVATGPDGALYVCDMYRQYIDHARFFPESFSTTHDMRLGEHHGRIYRIVPKGFAGSKTAKAASQAPKVPVLVNIDAPQKPKKGEVALYLGKPEEGMTLDGKPVTKENLKDKLEELKAHLDGRKLVVIADTSFKAGDLVAVMDIVYAANVGAGSKPAPTIRPIEPAPKDVKGLVAWLGHKNAWQRETAQRLLAENKPADLPASFSALLLDRKNYLARLHATWLLSTYYRNGGTPKVDLTGLDLGGWMEAKDTQDTPDKAARRLLNALIAFGWVARGEALVEAATTGMKRTKDGVVRVDPETVSGKPYKPRDREYAAFSENMMALAFRIGTNVWEGPFAGTMGPMRPHELFARSNFLATIVLGDEFKFMMTAPVLTGNADDPWMRRAVLSLNAPCKGQSVAMALKDQDFAKTYSSQKADTIRELTVACVADADPDDTRALLALTKREPGKLLWWKPALLQGISDGLPKSGGKLGVRNLTEFTSKAPDAYKDAATEITAILAQVDKVMTDSAAPMEQRLACLPLLPQRGWDKAEPIMRTLLADGQPLEISNAALALLKKFPADRTAPLLYELLPKLGPAARTDVVKVLTSNSKTVKDFFERIDRGELPKAFVDAETRWRYLRPNNPLYSLAEKIFGKPSNDRAAVITQYAGAVKQKGDATKGHQIFSSVCIACHRLKGEGVDVAPDITDVKIKEKEALLSDILDPNRMVEARWMAYQIDTKDARTVVGIISAETSSEVTIKMAGGITEAIPRANIAKMKSLDASLMPVGLEAGITKEQMADLLAYLKGE